MRFLLPLLIAALPLLSISISPSKAERVLTDPATQDDDPDIEFGFISLSPDGATIYATAKFETDTSGQQVWAVPVPANPATDTVTPVQLSTGDFVLDDYDVDSAPVVSPDGNTLLYVHDGFSGDLNTISTLDASGEFEATNFNGLFGSDPNLVTPGTANFGPTYSPDGQTIYFINAEAGFGGSVPSFDSSEAWANPDWDLLYSYSLVTETATPLTAAGDGDLEEGLYDLTPDGSTIVFAPDTPVATRRSQGSERSTLYTMPSAGGTPAEIAITSPTNPLFSISGQLKVTPDGQSVVFIGDYETPGKNELFSVPIAGGTPVKINDQLPFAGDVSSFAISPNGSEIAYSAGQNDSSTVEVFLKAADGSGTSIRISDPATANTGGFDAGTSGTGQILFSPDATEVYYLGDLTTAGVVDLYAVDKTEKLGATPSAYTYVGPDGGDFLDEANWEDADGNNPLGDAINADEISINLSLIIDGNVIGGSKSVASTFEGQVQFGSGGSLELRNGASLTFSAPPDIIVDGEPVNLEAQLDIDPGAGLKIVDSTLIVDDDVFMDGTIHLENAVFESVDDDLEFQDAHDTVIIDSLLTAGSALIVEGSLESVVGSTFTAPNTSIRFSTSMVVTDSDINMSFDLESLFANFDAEGSQLVLKGESTLSADTVAEGLDLVLDDQAAVTFNSLDANMVGEYEDGAFESMIIFASTAATLTLSSSPEFDVRDLIIDGTTGLSYMDDPSAWNITDWNGTSPILELQLASGAVLVGDYNDDGVVDAADYAVWRNNLDTSFALPNRDPSAVGLVGAADYDAWRQHYGEALSPPSSAISAPEPAGLACLLLAAGFLSLGVRPPTRS